MAGADHHGHRPDRGHRRAADHLLQPDRPEPDRRPAGAERRAPGWAPTSSAGTPGPGCSTVPGSTCGWRSSRCCSRSCSAPCWAASPAYFGGWTDLVIMRVVDVVVAFPFFVLLIALVFVLGPGARSIYIAITVVGWVSYCPASCGPRSWSPNARSTCWPPRAAGLSNTRIMGRHLMPNVISQAIIYAMSDIVQDILAIVTLGYFGLGIPPPTAEWGSMINERAELPDHALGADHDPRPRRDPRGARAVAHRRRARRPPEAGPVTAAFSPGGCRRADARGP